MLARLPGMARSCKTTHPCRSNAAKRRAVRCSPAAPCRHAIASGLGRNRSAEPAATAVSTRAGQLHLPGRATPAVAYQARPKPPPPQAATTTPTTASGATASTPTARSPPGQRPPPPHRHRPNPRPNPRPAARPRPPGPHRQRGHRRAAAPADHRPHPRLPAHPPTTRQNNITPNPHCGFGVMPIS